MELISVLLSILLGIFSPAGLAVDQVVEDALRANVSTVEELEVRVDNTPSLQLLQGKVSKIRIAGQGIYPIPELRIATLEVETDPLDVNVREVRRGSVQLDQPLQSGVRLVIEAEDINRLLQSPRITNQLRSFGISFLNAPQAIQAQRYEFVDPQVTFLDNDRIRADVIIQDQQTLEQLALRVETGFTIVAGRQLQLIDPVVLANGEAAPNQFIRALSAGISQRLDARSLAEQGLTLRILDWQVRPEAIELVAFVRIEPAAPILSGIRQTQPVD
jgi:hypothetical protein